MYDSISIIGAGFVGKAIYHAFSPYMKVFIYDKFIDGYNTLEEAVNSSTFIFLAVPTPVDLDNGGKQDLSNIKKVLEDIKSITTSRKIIIIKSTILPGTTRKLAQEYHYFDFVFNPEFLTERTATLDFLNQTRIVIGTYNNPDLVSNEVEKLYRKRFFHTPIFKTTYETAELLKYMCNCFFSMKVSFMNEMYDICQKMNIKYEDLRNMFLGDQRIGNSHTQVPGFDGHRGFGGKCFPKDLKSFIYWGRKQGHPMTLFEATDKVNERVREVKDWKEIKGATSKNNYKKRNRE